MSRDRRRERGMTVIEALVAVLVFSVVFLAALGLYQAANKAYMATDAATIQQQNIRFAMDRIGDSIRGSGADYNVAGLLSIPDEQIEGAWQAAIFMRGNYNDARETALESTSHPIVTTGNDEIVGYVLRKANGPNSQTLTITADFSSPRDASLTSGTITNEETSGAVTVAATTLADETDPPYQLTKVTFDASGNPKYEVIADNIFRMSFSYVDNTGAAMTTYGSADGTSLADRAARASIRQVDVNLIGMADRPDFGYSDPNTYTPAEGTTTKNLHKFALAEHFVPPNLGKIGRRHGAYPSIDIVAPVSITVCTGHCRYYHISWPATTTPGITTYMLHVTADAGANPITAPAVDVNTNVTGLTFDYMQPDSDTTRPFHFSVAGLFGVNPGTFSPVASATSSNQLAASTPSPPTVVAGTQGPGNNINVTWTAPTTSAGSLSGTLCVTAGVGAGTSSPTAPWTTALPDLGYYKVFRVRNDGVVTANFTTSATNRIDDKSIGPLQNTPKPGDPFMLDNLAAPCTAYFYKVQACDLCDVASADSAGSASTGYGLSDPSVVPAAPATLNGSISTSGGNYRIALTWAAVTQTAGGALADTAHYRISREYNTGGPWTALSDVDVYETTTYTDTVPTTQGSPAVSAQYRYAVRAMYDCGSPRISLPSPYYIATCQPSGTLSVVTPTNGTDYPRPYSTQVLPVLSVSGTGWSGATVQITDAGGGLKYNQTLTSAGPTYTFPVWDVSDTSAHPDGTYTMTATATAGACVTNPVTIQFTLSTTTCSLGMVNAAWNGNNGHPNNQLDFRIDNNCTATNLTFNQMKFSWSGVLSTAFIQTIQYNGNNITATLTAATGGNGVNITLSTPQTINANSTSNTFSLLLSDDFTNDGSRTGTPGKFSSAIVHETSPTTANDELIIGNPVP
ncbi:MAG TPA: prepilin-type N-terminal cleavage/methylation domain-containing protein [Thermoanaerobaculia bacterium]|nr:prepilin-type N-terminal cleavage/methylation domain-containing protein [Thermoanaerobaculia bacterium]